MANRAIADDGEDKGGRGLACAKCGHCRSEVLDSRGTVGGDRIRRRRVCASCGHRWTTMEVAVDWDSHRRARRNVKSLLDRLRTAIDEALS